MAENPYSPNTNEDKVVSNNNKQDSLKNNSNFQGNVRSNDSLQDNSESNNSTQSSVINNSTSEKKSKKSKKDEEVLFVTIEEDYEPIYVKIKRLIPKIIDEYVTTYKQPVRRSKLQDLVFGYDDKLAEFYKERKEAAVAVFSFVITKLVREKKIMKVKDPDKKRPTYYILPKHVEMFKK
jgi:hypothetical protein